MGACVPRTPPDDWTIQTLIRWRVANNARPVLAIYAHWNHDGTGHKLFHAKVLRVLGR